MSIKIISRQLISKGWSSDKKFKVKLDDGRLGLLRIADLTVYERKWMEFNVMQALTEKKFPTSQPIELWRDKSFVYSLYEWIEGHDMIDVASNLSNQQLYDLGCQAGNFLRELHSFPIDQTKRDWKTFYQSKIDQKIVAYQQSKESYNAGQVMLDFVQSHRHLLGHRPIVFQHGDFHTGNFLFGIDGRLKVLDFDRHDIGDPWEEFNRIVFTASLSPAFASGQIHSYFEGRVPAKFWSLLLLYLTVNNLGALAWAEQVSPDQIPLMKEQAAMLCSWFKGYEQEVPNWYQENK